MVENDASIADNEPSIVTLTETSSDVNDKSVGITVDSLFPLIKL